MNPPRNRLRQAREDAGLTQEALAWKAKTNTGTISRLENGRGGRPHKLIRLALAKALGVEVDELFPRPERKAS